MKAFLDKESWFSFPVSVHELRWDQFSDFRACEQRFFLANNPPPELDENGEEIEKPKPTKEDKINNATKSVDHIVELLDYVLAGDWQKIPFSVEGDNMQDLFSMEFRYNVKNVFDTEISLMRLYVHIVNMIDQYKPKKLPRTFKINWKGDIYTIDPLEAHKAISGIDYTVGETLTALEFQKKTIERINEKGDPDGNMAFNLGCRELAILLRKKGEELPWKRRERIKFIDSRVKVFTDLPLNVVLDVRFFFLNILKRYEITHTTNSSSKGLKMKQQQIRIAAKMRHRLKNGKRRGK